MVNLSKVIFYDILIVSAKNYAFNTQQILQCFNLGITLYAINHELFHRFCAQKPVWVN